MRQEKFKNIFEDLDVWLKQTSGFGADINLENYDKVNGDYCEAFVKIFVEANTMPATIISNKCKESIEANTYMGDQIEIHNEYIEVTKGSNNKDLTTSIIPYDKIILVQTYSRPLK